ncbi:hypothetical protein MLD38_009569 [Melastoma candidum]|uniref:Uncharacterized protein n=1 Tax=Melastoma candidum TaxID=119954 RepID=A0ACB9S6H1_9MYRT|nr:hypothetical protein MLD38_009569 [Melastoma candidum]
MSNRGSGRRGTDSLRHGEADPPLPGGARSRGRGRGRGRDGGSVPVAWPGRGCGVPTSPPSAPHPPPTTTPSPATSSSSPDLGGGDLTGRMEQKLTLVGQVAVSSKGMKFPDRPGYGTVGRKCMVKANHFLLEVSQRDLHHYDVSISPEVTSKKVNRLIISQLVNTYRLSHLAKRMPAYDGGKSLYTAGALPFEIKEFIVMLSDKDEAASDSKIKRNREFKVKISFASRPDLSHLQQYLVGRLSECPHEVVQALDVVLRASPAERYTVVGRSFFAKELGAKGDLGEGLEYWRGYYQSIRPTQFGLSVNIDVSARAFYEAIPVTEFIGKYCNLRDLGRTLTDQERFRLKKVLKGVRVQTSYTGWPKKHKITGLSEKSVMLTMFAQDDKKMKISVGDYFHQRYNIVLKWKTLPALQMGSDAKPVYIPMELCSILEGQRYTRKLNERQVSALLRATCRRPPEREKEILGSVKNNPFFKDALVSQEFGMNVRSDLALVEARVLPPPVVKYFGTGVESRVNPQTGQWNMINKKMVNPGKVEHWTCVTFSSRLDYETVVLFCKDLVGMCRSRGMDFNPNPVIPIRHGRSNEIEKVLCNIQRESGHPTNLLHLLIIILPDSTGSYGKIKRICETELGIVSQCCQPRQASKNSKQYLENVSLKINVKVGGRNSVLEEAIQRTIPFYRERATIIFGADVTHPQPGDDESPSIAAVVASMDWPQVTTYRGLISALPEKGEIISDLYTKSTNEQNVVVHGGMIRELLRAFRRSTNTKPDRIIFYRDGVGEGQFSEVLFHEVDAIHKACNSLEEGYLPPVTFVLVQKRHHTRFFPMTHGDRSSTDRSGNVLPGTVVDTKICHPTGFDFYLNSHAGIQGTSRPTHYHVLYDDNKFTADTLQALTNNLCYTYARCTRSVSIVPPAYYAHLAAFRARYYMERESSDAGSGSGRGTRSGNVEFRVLPTVKENVKNVMFYC